MLIRNTRTDSMNRACNAMGDDDMGVNIEKPRRVAATHEMSEVVFHVNNAVELSCHLLSSP